MACFDQHGVFRGHAVDKHAHAPSVMIGPAMLSGLYLSRTTFSRQVSGSCGVNDYVAVPNSFRGSAQISSCHERNFPKLISFSTVDLLLMRVMFC